MMIQVRGYLQWWTCIRCFFTLSIVSNSETTWTVGIALLTHYEVRDGDNNAETGGIFAPTTDRVVS